VVTRVRTGASSIKAEICGWLADIPRRAGQRLFMSIDEESYWRGWRLTERWGGLSRTYRDARFDAQQSPRATHGQACRGQLPPDGEQ